MDIKLTCSDCGRIFNFTSKEQAFYIQKGFNYPKRCKDCRENHYSKPGLKTTSFYEDARVFGARANVRGGLYVEQVYYIKSPEKGFLAFDNGKLFFNPEITDETIYDIDRAEIVKICEAFNQKYRTKCEVYSQARYVGMGRL